MVECRYCGREIPNKPTIYQNETFCNESCAGSFAEEKAEEAHDRWCEKNCYPDLEED